MPVRVSAAAPLAPPAQPGPVPPPPPIPRPLLPLTGAGPERAAAHRENLARRAADARDYAAYVERFVAGHAACRTLAEADAYAGALVPPPEFTPGGATLREVLDLADGPNDDGHRALRSAADRLSDHRLRLQGLRAPLSVEWNAAAAAELRAGKTRYALDVAAGPDGFVAEASAGTPVAKATANTRGALCAEVGFVLGSATVCDGKLDRLELDPLALGPVGPLVATDGESVTVGLRAGWKGFKPRAGEAAPWWNVAAEARGTARLQLLSAEVVAAALQGTSLVRGAPVAGASPAPRPGAEVAPASRD